VTAVVLHLSDIHIKTSRDPILKRAPDIARALYRALPDASAVLVVVSGDIAFSGETSQYADAAKFFAEIKAAIQSEKDIPIHFIPCPGNHDCDFSKDDSTRKMVLGAVQLKGLSSIDDSVIRTCVAVQESYFSFEDSLTNGVSKVSGDSLWKSYDFTIEGKTLTLDSLNELGHPKKLKSRGLLVSHTNDTHLRQKNSLTFVSQCCTTL
jgi:DNA repair exonuclease SbcCD nuclease subunit